MFKKEKKGGSHSGATACQKISSTCNLKLVMSGVFLVTQQLLSVGGRGCNLTLLK